MTKSPESSVSASPITLLPASSATLRLAGPWPATTESPDGSTLTVSNCGTVSGVLADAAFAAASFCEGVEAAPCGAIAAGLETLFGAAAAGAGLEAALAGPLAVLPETLDADFEGVAGEALAVGGADLLCGTLTAP